jgi:nucleoside-diphosphate-sugar epimerase
MATNYGVGQALASTVMTNVVMPLRILEYAARGGCPLFVNTDTFFSKQNYNYNHMKSYTASKVELVKWIELFLCENSEVRVVNARLEHVYGPGDSLPKFVPFAIQQLIKNEPLDLSPGEQVRDFIYVGDVVSAYITLVNSAKKLRTGLTEFEVGTGVGYSIRTLVEIAKNLTQSKSILNFGAMPYRPSEIMHSIANTHNLIDMGWMPKVSLKDGLLATINKAKVL